MRAHQKGLKKVVVPSPRVNNITTNILSAPACNDPQTNRKLPRVQKEPTSVPIIPVPRVENTRFQSSPEPTSQVPRVKITPATPNCIQSQKETQSTNHPPS